MRKPFFAGHLFNSHEKHSKNRVPIGPSPFQIAVVDSVAGYRFNINRICHDILKTSPCNIQQYFATVKMFIIRRIFFFLIFAQNIDCGYT